MVKLIVLVTFFAISQASSYETIITETIESTVSETSRSNGGVNGYYSKLDCRQLIQALTQEQFEQLFRPCQIHLSQQSQSSDIAMVMDREPQQQLQECCQQLRKIDEECRCEAIQKVVDQQQKQQQQQQQQHQEEGQKREQQLTQIVHKAEQLTESCNISPRRCQIRIQSS